jgi:hypothetical protein
MFDNVRAGPYLKAGSAGLPGGKHSMARAMKFLQCGTVSGQAAVRLSG